MDDMLMTINNNVVRLSVQVENLCRRMDERKAEIDSLDKRVDALEKASGNTALQWLKYIGTGIISVVISFVAVKVGLK